MINEAPPFKGLNISIPVITPFQGRGLLINGLQQGLGFRLQGLRFRVGHCLCSSTKMEGDKAQDPTSTPSLSETASVEEFEKCGCCAAVLIP